MKFNFGKPGWTPKGQPPCRTLKELADEFGVAPNRLAGLIRHDACAPRRLITTGGNSWYDPKAMRAWWAARKAAA